MSTTGQPKITLHLGGLYMQIQTTYVCNVYNIIYELNIILHEYCTPK